MRRGREEEYSLMQEEEADSHESQGICGIRSMFLLPPEAASISAEKARETDSFPLSLIPAVIVAEFIPGKEFSTHSSIFS